MENVHLSSPPLSLSLSLAFSRSLFPQTLYRAYTTRFLYISLIPVMCSCTKRTIQNISLLEITTNRIIRLGIANFDTFKLPAELLDHLLTATNTSSCAKRKIENTKFTLFSDNAMNRFHRLPPFSTNHDSTHQFEELNSQTTAISCIESLCSIRDYGIGNNVAALIIFRLVAGFAENPDWRDRESLIRLTGALAIGAPVYAAHHIEDLNTILAHTVKALDDPVVHTLRHNTYFTRTLTLGSGCFEGNCNFGYWPLVYENRWEGRRKLL